MKTPNPKSPPGRKKSVYTQEELIFIEQLMVDEPRRKTGGRHDQFWNFLDYKFEEFMGARRNQFFFFIAALFTIYFVFGLLFYLVGGYYGKHYSDLTMLEAAWQAWTLILDPGVEFNTLRTPNRAVAGLTTVVGVIFAAMLTGFVVDAVKTKLDGFRAGRTQVQEWDHTVLIGWTDRTVGFVLQVCKANENRKDRKKGVIVVLVEMPKQEAERLFYTTVNRKELLGSKVVFRSGSPQVVASLHLVGVPRARSVVLMSSGDDLYKADAATLRAIVAITVVGIRPTSYIVAEVRDPEMDTVIRFTGGSQLETIHSTDFNARMSLTAVKQPGITSAFEEILGFEGDEFYTRVFPEVAGKMFGQMAEHFPATVPIGVRRHADGEVCLVPPSEYVMQKGDALIVVAEDSAAFAYHKEPARAAVGDDENAKKLPKYHPPPRKQDRLLVCGWGENLKGIVKMLNLVFDEGTEVHLCNRIPLNERVERMRNLGLDDDSFSRLELTHVVGNPAHWHMLRTLDLPSYSVVLVVSDVLESETFRDFTAVDSQNLATILLLRNHEELMTQEAHDPSLVLSPTRLGGGGGCSGMHGHQRDLQLYGGGRERSALGSPVKGKGMLSRGFSNMMMYDPTKASLSFNSSRSSGGGGGGSNVSDIANNVPVEEDALFGGNTRGGGSVEKGVSAKKKTTQPIFVEIRDPQTQDLVESHKYLHSACHFLVSNKLIAKVLAMVSEDRTVRKILDLLLAGNTTMTLIPAELYVEAKERVPFYTVMRRARMFRHIVLGYQHKTRHTLTCINPKDKATPRHWHGVANFVVLAQASAESERRRAEMSANDASLLSAQRLRTTSSSAQQAAGEEEFPAGSPPQALPQDGAKLHGSVLGRKKCRRRHKVRMLSHTAVVFKSEAIADDEFPTVEDAPRHRRRSSKVSQSSQSSQDEEEVEEGGGELVQGGRMAMAPTTENPLRHHSGGSLRRNSGGVTAFVDVDLSLKQSLGFRVKEHQLELSSSSAPSSLLVVSGVVAEGQASAMGVEVGWAVEAVDGSRVGSQQDLLALIDQAKKKHVASHAKQRASPPSSPSGGASSSPSSGGGVIRVTFDTNSSAGGTREHVSAGGERRREGGVAGAATLTKMAMAGLPPLPADIAALPARSSEREVALRFKIAQLESELSKRKEATAVSVLDLSQTFLESKQASDRQIAELQTKVRGLVLENGKENGSGGVNNARRVKESANTLDRQPSSSRSVNNVTAQSHRGGQSQQATRTRASTSERRSSSPSKPQHRQQQQQQQQQPRGVSVERVEGGGGGTKLHARFAKDVHSWQAAVDQRRRERPKSPSTPAPMADPRPGHRRSGTGTASVSTSPSSSADHAEPPGRSRKGGFQF